MSGDEVLDPATVAELLQAQREYGNPAFIAQLVALFRANAPVRMAKIREAVAARDARTLEHTAHTLKSNGGMLGATRLSELCGEFEAYGETAAFENAAVLLDEADAELARVLGALDTLMRSYP